MTDTPEMAYRRAGASGLLLPEVTLGLWQNFGADGDRDTQRAIVRTAVDLGICHLDLANNYGPPPGHAETVLGEMLRTDLSGRRDELAISTKAGYAMWDGPYGSGGSRKHLMASLDQSLTRLGVDHVDVFYSHRVDPDTPLTETMGALADIVAAGKARYVGVSSYSATRTVEAAALLAERGVPLTLHQPSYSMFNRWIEDDLLATLERHGIGCIAFSVLAQGLLTDRYLDGVPEQSRASGGGPFHRDWLTEDNLARVRALDALAKDRGQTLAQMAIAWSLRHGALTSALIGASSVEQLTQNVGALANTTFGTDELAEIDRHAVDAGIDLWAGSRAHA
jgi:L-glyceraldehyde 3-phosphate reductase